MAEHLEIEIEVIESGLGDSWKEAEKRWVAHYRAQGSRLTNLTDGGDGTLGIVRSEETRKKMSAASKGKGLWKKGLEAAVKANTGRKYPREQVEKARIARLGQKYSEDTIARMSEAALKRPPVTTETRAKLSRMRFGKKMPPSTGPKLTASNLERWKKLRDNLRPGEAPPWKGKKRTPEQVARMRAGRYPYLYGDQRPPFLPGMEL